MATGTENNNVEDELSTKLSALNKELDEQNKFLEMKSTDQQKKEGVEHPVDSAYVEDKNGTLMLKALFDVHLFKPEEILLKVEDGQLKLNAQCLDDTDNATYRKTMVRTLDLPEQADTKAMQCSVSPQGILTIEMPLHLAQKQPAPSPALAPIISEAGRRLIRLQFMIGPDFTMDDVKVESTGHDLTVRAFYEAELGADGAQVTRREFKKDFRLPETIEVEEVVHEMRSNGVLRVEIFLKSDSKPHYRCEVTTEEVTGKVKRNS